MSKFTSLSLESNFSVMSPVYFPARDGFVVIDTTGLHKRLRHEWFLVTREGLFFKLVNEPYFIKADDFKNVLVHRDNFTRLFVVILLFVLPAIFFWLYAIVWLKYVVSIFLLGCVFFTLFDLTHFRKSWKQMLNICVISSFVPVFLEVISLPFDSNYLFPLVETVVGDVYALPLVLHSIIIVLMVFVVHAHNRNN